MAQPAWFGLFREYAHSSADCAKSGAEPGEKCQVRETIAAFPILSKSAQLDQSLAQTLQVRNC